MPGQEYLITWAKDFLPGQKQSREQLAPGPFSPGRLYTRLGELEPRNTSQNSKKTHLGKIA